MGNGEFRPPGAETAEPIEMKLGMGDVGDPTTHAQNEKCT